MNYQAHYNRLVERAKNRTLEGYVERHHAVPKCMGGTDDESNIVILTAKEHFVAHQTAASKQFAGKKQSPEQIAKRVAARRATLMARAA